MRRLILALCLLLSLLGGAFALMPEASAGGCQARAVALVRRLRTQRIQNATFEAIQLPAFLKWLRVATGRNFMVDLRAFQKAGIDPKTITFTAQLEDVTVATLLGFALESHGLAAVVRGNVVLVTTRAASLGKPITRMYSISHITWTKTDFIAPDINLKPSNFTPMDEYEPERVVENDPLDSGDAVSELLQELVARGEWDSEGWRISATDRYLVVRAPRSVHRKIPGALTRIASLM